MAQFSVENGSICSDVSIITPENANLKKSNFTYGLQPIYYFSRIFGYMPFKLVLNSNGLIKSARIRLFDTLWTVFSIGIHLFATFHFLLTAGCTTENFEKSVILANGTKALVIVRRLFNCLCLAMEICQRVRFVETLKELNLFDEKAISMLNFVGFNSKINKFFTNTSFFCERRWQPLEFILIMQKSVVCPWIIVLLHCWRHSSILSWCHLMDASTKIRIAPSTFSLWSFYAFTFMDQIFIFSSCLRYCCVKFLWDFQLWIVFWGNSNLAINYLLLDLINSWWWNFISELQESLSHWKSIENVG